ncbi:MAG: YdgA family protein [Candidatus Accumulibacter sp.]|nr:YdgA family protein [Accumulibacter sp.]
MKKKSIILAAAAVVLAAGYAASSWYLGKRIETALAEIDARIIAQPWLSLVRHDYERGLLSARDTIVVDIPAAAFRPAPPAGKESEQAVPASGQPLRVTLRTSVRHGPLPGFGAPAVATASTVVEFDEAVAEKVKEAFGGKPAVEIRSSYDFDGGGRSAITSPPFTIAVPGRVEGSRINLSGDGLDFAIEFSRGLAQYSLRGGAPRLEGVGADGARFTLSGLSVDGAQQRLFPDEPLLHTGVQKLSIVGLEIDPGPGRERPKLALKDFTYDAEVSASGEHIDVIARFGAAGLVIDEQDYGPAAYDFSMKHLHARKFAVICRDLMDLHAKAGMLRDRERTLRALVPLLSNLGALLLENPVLSIDRIAFRTPEGEAAASASVRLPDVGAEDLMRPWLLIGKIDAEADLALPVTLVKTLALAGDERRKRAETVDGAIADFVGKGYVAIDGGLLRSRLAFRDGSLTANDRQVWP